MFDFETICSRTPLPLCAVIQSGRHFILSNSTTIHDFNPQHLHTGILPRCYARSIDVANTMIFNVGNAFVNIGALGVLLMILYNIRQKFTAIGRAEYLHFFQLALLMIIFTLIVNTGASPPGSGSYPYFVAIQIGLAGACCWNLLVNAFLGFNLWEDGTKKSMFLTRGAAFLGFVANFLVAILTFKTATTTGTIDKTHTTALFVITYVISGIMLLVYTICQLLVSVLVVHNLWVAGAVMLGVFFFVAGQVLVYGVSDKICKGANHYIDGLFCGSLCNLFTLMMVYKIWDMTTDDDLEFSVTIHNEDGVVYNNALK
ncbi:hypothetical protein ZYGR_0AV02110 [Zygosaccharomyces rouxii]|uniref:Chitin synthase export chaperone n=1 Tax=Zygosaccharomyces rouxii TaxID=4956 RepID=A0A1Q3AIP1_ZYGRO|nr:hypothetical protein ZYGR_0AV02110 [Zygosaccharomyces rouxii]